MSNTVLAIYLGETYVEIEARAAGLSGRQNKTKTSLFHKSLFLPQSSFKNSLNQFIKSLATTDIVIEKAFVVTRYLDRLKPFRLGGSVVQVTEKLQENNYTFENSKNLSLAAASLIVTIDEDTTAEDLNMELQKIKKINPDANKVVFNVGPHLKNQLESTRHFFKENGFTEFVNESTESMKNLRKTLINAGTEGTKEEIIKDLVDGLSTLKLQRDQIHFWVGQQFTTKYENVDLFFSADDFLTAIRKKHKKKTLIHTDIERLVLFNEDTSSVWKSPWGSVDHQQATNHSIGIQPCSEIVIDQGGLLQFSQQNMATEPNPMIAGRSVKSLVIDVFAKNLAEHSLMVEMFQNLTSPQLIQKIDSQFKALEKGQNQNYETFSLEKIKSFIIQQIFIDLDSYDIHESNCEWTGHLNTLFNPQHKKFSWTSEIFERVGN